MFCFQYSFLILLKITKMCDKMDQTSYEDYHLSYMHSDGSSEFGVLITILPIILFTTVTTTLVSLMYSYGVKSPVTLFLVEFVFLVLPSILNMTVLANSNIILPLYGALFIILYFFVVPKLDLRKAKKVEISKPIGEHFLTNARSTINLLSVIAILAVDFDIFPRKFAKTKAYGVSLMDVGVGLYVYSNGIVTPFHKLTRIPLSKHIKGVIPFFVIGTLRFILTQQVNYKVPVMEYGVHWNFFITLGVIKLFTAALVYISGSRFLYHWGVLLIIFNQLILVFGVEHLIMTDIERSNIFWANKEGIGSLLGYLTVYINSICLAQSLYLLKMNRKEIYNLLFWCWFISLVIYILLSMLFPASRKLANPTYFFWVYFIGVFMTFLFYFVNGFLDKTPLIYEAINYNGLIFFLLSNILTGVVNMAVNTLEVNRIYSLLTICLYMMANCAVVYFLYLKKWKLKL